MQRLASRRWQEGWLQKSLWFASRKTLRSWSAPWQCGWALLCAAHAGALGKCLSPSLIGAGLYAERGRENPHLGYKFSKYEIIENKHFILQYTPLFFITCKLGFYKERYSNKWLLSEHNRDNLWVRFLAAASFLWCQIEVVSVWILWDSR